MTIRKLHLIRHAKSSWSEPSLADIDRPLNQRGVDSCGIMAEQIFKAGCNFEHVYCSPAVRAQLTIKHLSKNLTNKNIHWQLDPALYTFDPEVLINWCRDLPDDVLEVVIVGHNPALTCFSNEISDRYIDNVSTCGYLQLTATLDSWENLSANTAQTTHYLTPKMFR